MKKFLCLFIVCLLVVAFAACKDNGADNTATPSATVDTSGTQTSAVPTQKPTEAPTADPGAETLKPDLLEFAVNEDGSATNKVDGGPEITAHGAAKVVSVDEATGLNVVTLSGGGNLYNAVIGDYYGDMEQAFTMEVYFRVDALPTSGYVGVAENCENGGFGLYVYSDGTLEFDMHLDGKYEVVKSTIVAGEWYHCVCTWDSEFVRMYVNGELADEYDSSYAFVAFPTDESAMYLAIGGCCSANSHGGMGMQGTIGVCNLYLYALEATEITTLYQDLTGAATE